MTQHIKICPQIGICGCDLLRQDPVLGLVGEKQELASHCCGAKMTEPDSSGLATCYECHEGCVAEDPEETKFLEEQAKLIAEQEALNMGADPSNHD